MSKVDPKYKDNIYIVINLILAVVTMSLAILLTSRIMDKDQNTVSLFLAIAIGSQVLFQILLFIVKDTKKDKFRALLGGVIYLAAIAVALVAREFWEMFYIANALFVFAMAVNQFLLIQKEETKKGMITHILLGVTLILFTVAILTSFTSPEVEAQAINISIITVILLLITSLKKLLFPSVRFEKIRLLINIIIKTHTFDVIIGLLSFMIAFSFIFPMVEDSITNFWDALWYCFTVITTIGFGDFAATSVAGRILTVVLGIYGIVVVAILTSVVVNYYNEANAKEKAKDIIE